MLYASQPRRITPEGYIVIKVYMVTAAGSVAKYVMFIATSQGFWEYTGIVRCCVAITDATSLRMCDCRALNIFITNAVVLHSMLAD